MGSNGRSSGRRQNCINLELFFSTFALIFVAELPDKTALAIIALATRNRPWGVFFGVACAFLVQSIVAVLFGRALQLIPEKFVTVGSGIIFLIFAFVFWRRRYKPNEQEPIEPSAVSWSRSFISSFVIIFIAEWGDLTQIATATLVAKYPYPFTIFVASVLALWTTTALAVGLGRQARRMISMRRLESIAAVLYLLVGIYILVPKH